jgi:hypothetical protein
MVSGSSLSASQAYSSVTVSPWKVRGLGICFASGGSMLMKAQSKEFHKRPKVVDYDGFVSLVAERPWCGPGRRVPVILLMPRTAGTANLSSGSGCPLEALVRRRGSASARKGAVS